MANDSTPFSPYEESANDESTVRSKEISHHQAREVIVDYTTMNTINLLLLMQLPKFMKKETVKNNVSDEFVRLIAESLVRIKYAPKVTEIKDIESIDINEYFHKTNQLITANNEMLETMHQAFLNTFDIPEINQQSIENLSPSIAMTIFKSFLGGKKDGTS